MEVTAVESTITNVMDLYYSWLVKLVGPKGNDRIALLGTITVHDIDQKAPLYTNQVFRQFADRTITISPEDFGPGNTNDRYSVIYDRAIAVAGSQLYAKASLSPEQQVLLGQYQADQEEAIREIKGIRTEARDDWNAYVNTSDLKPGTPQYVLEKAKFYEPYISLIGSQRQKITHARAKRRAIWLSVFADDAEARQLAEVFENCNAPENLQSLPTANDIEVTYGLDPITISAAADSGMFAFETSLGILPSGTLTKILDLEGARGATFSSGETETHNHDAAWSASASGGWGIWKANASASEETHFRQSIKNLESISITCDFIGEYWVSRRNWYDSTIFENSYLSEYFDDNATTTALIANVISSLIIARGLKLTYKFNHVDDTKIWSSYNYSAGGGFSVFGISAGLGGSSSGSKLDHVINETDKTVTFADGKNVCRLLALRVSRNIAMPDEQVAFLHNPLESTLWGQQLISSWRNGEMTSSGVPNEMRTFSRSSRQDRRGRDRSED